MATAVSLHIGVNDVDPDHYGGWSGPLQACEADATDMAALAAAQGFETSTLLTAAATREAVVAGIAAAAERLAAGDMFLLTYAGHGGQVPDKSGDEPDGFDETWCLYDGQLLDDELAAQWLGFEAGVRILVISDSCHSGTATRAPQLVDRATITRSPVAEALGVTDARYRFMPLTQALRTYRTNREFYDGIQERTGHPGDPEATVRLLSGCQDNQLSLDGDANGLFTTMLLMVWDDGAFTGNYADFHREILALMPATQSPNHYVIGPPDADFDAASPFTP